MRLHVKSCVYCNRCAVRVDGEKEWHRNLVDIPVQRLKELHQVVSTIEVCCTDCEIKIVKDLAVTAGAVH